MSGLGGNPMLVQGYVHTVPDRETTLQKLYRGSVNSNKCSVALQNMYLFEKRSRSARVYRYVYFYGPMFVWQAV